MRHVFRSTKSHIYNQLLCTLPFLNPLLLIALFLAQQAYKYLKASVIMGGLPIQSPSSTITLRLQKDQVSAAVKSEPDSKPKKKICCACPETKTLRDECIVEHGESACEKWIEAHRKCLRAEGFNV